MATVVGQGTELRFILLPPKAGEKGWATTKITLQNEYISYADEGEYLSVTDVEELGVALSRLLAGAYEREYSLTLDGAGLAVDMYPPMENGRTLSREARREKDCVVAFRLLLRSKDKKKFLDGVHTLLAHRERVEAFVKELREEYRQNYLPLLRGRGKYHFVGVSPRGMEGCNYQYLDESGEVQIGDYVWVRMGRRQILQVVYVDSVRDYDEEDAPYNPRTVKKVLRKATEEETQAYLKEWKK